MPHLDAGELEHLVLGLVTILAALVSWWQNHKTRQHQRRDRVGKFPTDKRGDSPTEDQSIPDRR